MSATHQLRCINCGTRIAGESVSSDFRCPDCRGLYEVIYPWSEGVADLPADFRLPNPTALRYKWQELRTSTMPVDQSGVWRFRDLLPIVANFDNVVTLREGNTPLYDLPKCAADAGIDWLLAKHQGMNPTGSFKDTGMTAALSVAAERGFEWVACASTGNTSAAMAAYAARAGLRCLVFIPEGKIAWGKLSQSMDYGAMTVQLKTDFDGCVRLLNELVRRFPIYLLNSVNPYRLEGQKTPAMEMLEQLEWQVPEHIIVPGGNLANSAALGKGFAEMKHIGLIPRLPKISVIQAEGANPLYRWYNDANREMKPVTADTRATAIRIGNPASPGSRPPASSKTWAAGASRPASRRSLSPRPRSAPRASAASPPPPSPSPASKSSSPRPRHQREERVVLILTGHTLKDSAYTIDYHRGALLTPEEFVGATPDQRAQHASLAKPPMILEADSDTVLRALEPYMQNARQSQPV